MDRLLEIETPTTGGERADAAARPDVADVEPGTPLQGGRARAWVESAIAAVLASLLFVLGFGGGLGRLRTPLGGGDLIPAYATSQLWGAGAPMGNSSYGFPFGMELRYYPTGELLQNLLAGLATGITGDPFFGLNFLFAVSFPLTAVAAMWVLRVAGLRGAWAILAALALTFVPYHWFRISHIYLGTMYSAVLAVGLALLVGTGEVERRLRSRSRWPFVLLLVFLAVVIGASGIYYACFAALLCVVAGLYRISRGARWRDLLLAVVPAVLVVAVLGAVLLPSLLFTRAHPPIDPVAQRQAIESVIYSGSLAFSLLPAPVSLIPGFGPVNSLVDRTFAAAQAQPGAGVLWYADFGSVATIVALAVVAGGGLALARRSARSADTGAVSLPPVGRPEMRLGLLAVLAATGLLFFVPWGLNYLFASFVTPQLRGWDRLVPVLFTLLFVAAGLILQRLRLALPRYAGAGLLVLAAVVLLLDSVLPYRSYFADAAANGGVPGKAGYAYAAALNKAVPEHCGVLELPYIAYPEEPPKVDLANYGPLWPALTNPEKSWSAGAMKGTLDSAWQRTLGDSLEESDIAPLQAAGFCIVHVDERGYTPENRARVIDELETLLGRPVATGYDGNWVAYELPSADGDPLPADRLTTAPGRVGTFFAPPRVLPEADTAVAAPSDALETGWSLSQDTGTFDAESLPGGPAFRSVEGRVAAGACGDRDVVLTVRSGGRTASQTVHVTADQPADFSLPLDSLVRNAALSVAATGDACPAGSPDPARTIELLDVRAVG